MRPSLAATRPHGSASGGPAASGVTAPVSASTANTAPSSPPLSTLRSVTTRLPSGASAMPAGLDQRRAAGVLHLRPVLGVDAEDDRGRRADAGIGDEQAPARSERDAPRVGELPARGDLAHGPGRRIDAVDRLGSLVADDQFAGAVEDHVGGPDEGRALRDHRALTGRDVDPEDGSRAAGTGGPVGDVDVARARRSRSLRWPRSPDTRRESLSPSLSSAR